MHHSKEKREAFSYLTFSKTVEMLHGTVLPIVRSECLLNSKKRLQNLSTTTQCYSVWPKWQIIYLKAIISCKPISDVSGEIYPILSPVFCPLAYESTVAIWKWHSTVTGRDTVGPHHAYRGKFSTHTSMGNVCSQNTTLERKTTSDSCINWGTFNFPNICTKGILGISFIFSQHFSDTQ